MKDFSPELCQCTLCGSYLRSRWVGEFVMCECGQSFVDQTVYYSRYGGSIISVHDLILEDFARLLNVDDY